jgi:hypothetical protein
MEFHPEQPEWRRAQRGQTCADSFIGNPNWLMSVRRPIGYQHVA